MFDFKPGPVTAIVVLGVVGVAVYALLDVFLSLRHPAAPPAPQVAAAPAPAAMPAPPAQVAPAPPPAPAQPAPRYVGIPQGAMPVYRCKEGDTTVFSDRPCGEVTGVLVVAAPRPDDPNFRPRSYREQLDRVRALGAGGEQRGGAAVAALGTPPSEKQARCAAIYKRIDALNEQARTSAQSVSGSAGSSFDPGRAKRDAYDEAFRAGC
ncbi:MAG: hypothetical protein N2544_11955 [Burkholderiales bacterium]|nr:hypothetical protein [Burkholderiales bacterium]